MPSQQSTVNSDSSDTSNSLLNDDGDVGTESEKVNRNLTQKTEPHITTNKESIIHNETKANDTPAFNGSGISAENGNNNANNNANDNSTSQTLENDFIEGTTDTLGKLVLDISIPDPKIDSIIIDDNEKQFKDDDKLITKNGTISKDSVEINGNNNQHKKKKGLDTLGDYNNDENNQIKVQKKIKTISTNIKNTPRKLKKLHKDGIKPSSSPKNSHSNSTDDEFPSGAIVLAKIKGYPSWPAMILPESYVPKNVLAQKPKTSYKKLKQKTKKNRRKSKVSKSNGSDNDSDEETRNRVWPIRFLADSSYGWPSKKEMKFLSKNDAEEYLEKNRYAKEDLLNAYREVLNPPSLDDFAPQYENNDDEMESENEYDDEIESEDEYDEPEIKEKYNKQKKHIKSEYYEDEEEEEEEEKVQVKGRKSLKQKSTESSKRDKTTNITSSPLNKRKLEKGDRQTGSAKKQKIKPSTITKSESNNNRIKEEHHHSNSSSNSSSNSGSDSQSSNPKYNRIKRRIKEVWFIRHKLQKGLLQPPTFPNEEELEKINLVFIRLENIKDMEFDVIKDTKINKVLKAIVKTPNLEFKESFKYHERSLKLLRAWNPVIVSNNDGHHRTASSSSPAPLNNSTPTRPLGLSRVSPPIIKDIED